MGSAPGERSFPVVMLGTFGLRPKGTMSARALPLAMELAAAGRPVRLVLAPWDWPADAGRRDVHGGVEVVNVALAGGPAAVVARLISAARQDGPALVHCFKPKGYGGLAAAALRLAGWPLVVDVDDWEGPGGWNDRVAAYTPAHRLLFAWQAWALPRSAQAVTVASRTLETQAWGLGIPPARVRYVPNGLSARRHTGWRDAPAGGGADRAALGLGAEPVIGLYTRWDVVAPERVVALLAAVRRRVPEAQLLVVGSGAGGEEARLWAAARAAGLAGAIRATGFVAFERLPALLRLADVAIYPIDDTLVNRAKAPVKLLELLALGLPVVAERVGETGEYIEPEISGRLVASGDAEAMAAAVVGLLGDPNARRRLGEAACVRVWRRYAWQDLSQTVHQVYRMAQGRAGR